MRSGRTVETPPPLEGRRVLAPKRDRLLLGDRALLLLAAEEGNPQPRARPETGACRPEACARRFPPRAQAEGLRAQGAPIRQNL